MARIKGKVAVVTGAAHGLGRAIAQALAAEGATEVIATDVDKAAGEQTVEEMRRAGFAASFHEHDVRSPEQWQAVFDYALGRHDSLDVLVNNAGLGTYSDIETCTLDEFRFVNAVNLEGTFIGTQMAVRAMKKTGGSIINISSVAAMCGTPNLLAYTASKAGVHMMTKSAAVYCGMAGYKIRINSVHPGLIDTRAGREMVRLATGQDEEAALDFFRQMHPIGRIGVPGDIAQAVLFLASDESSFCTGSALVVDGGMTARP